MARRQPQRCRGSLGAETRVRRDSPPSAHPECWRDWLGVLLGAVRMTFDPGPAGEPRLGVDARTVNDGGSGAPHMGARAGGKRP